MARNRLVLEWIDAAGGFMRSGGFIDSSFPLATLASAVANASNANLAFATDGLPFISSVAAVPGVTWYLTTDTAVLIFATAVGTYVTLIIPAPDQSMFLPGGTVIDPSAAKSAAVITAVIGSLMDPAGNLVTAYVQGSKGSRRTEQGSPPG